MTQRRKNRRERKTVRWLRWLKWITGICVSLVPFLIAVTKLVEAFKARGGPA